MGVGSVIGVGVVGEEIVAVGDEGTEVGELEGCGVTL